MTFWETKNKVKFDRLNIDYEGTAKVLLQFSELYKVCDNKEMLDKHLDSFLSQITYRDIYNEYYNKYKNMF